MAQQSIIKKLGGKKKKIPMEQHVARFNELTQKDISDQTELFLKSFIFDLGDHWKVVNQLEKLFKKRIRDSNEGKDDMNPVMAADFLQKQGRERTALQRKEEVADIDLDNNGRIAFVEYLLLHFKCMIIAAYYKRMEEECPYDLSKDGIGVVGVGFQLLDELFCMPLGLDPELEAAIEEFTKQKKAKEKRVAMLEQKVAAGGVKGLAATNELKQMEAADQTEMNRIEITLQAAKRKASKQAGDVALDKKRKKVEAEEKAKKEASRNRLKAKAALWEKK